MKKVAILILFMLGCAISEGYAQKVALKSNLLYDATTTMNLGLEIGLVRKWTLDIPVNYNPWKLSPYVYRNARTLCRFQCRRVARLVFYQ